MKQTEAQKKYVGNLCARADSWEVKIKPKLELITGWARNGLSDKQIADNLGVGESTFAKFKALEDKLKDALTDGRRDAEVHVENALFKRACGYRYKETTKERKKEFDEKGNWTGRYIYVTTKSVVKHIAGDVNAQIYWLKNRAPERWHDKLEADINMTAVRIVDDIGG